MLNWTVQTKNSFSGAVSDSLNWKIKLVVDDDNDNNNQNTRLGTTG